MINEEDMTHALTRRAALAVAVSSALSAATIPTAIAAPDADADVLALAAAIMEIRKAWDARAEDHYAVYPDDMAYDICEQPEADTESVLVRQLAATPATTLHGLCIKVLIGTGFGDFAMESDLVAEVIALTGFEPEPSHPTHPGYRRATV